MLRCEAKPGVEVLVQKKVRALKEAGKTMGKRENRWCNSRIWQQVHLENMKLHKKQFVSLVSDISENVRENGFKIGDIFFRDCEWRLVDHFEDQNNVECGISNAFFGQENSHFSHEIRLFSCFPSEFPFCRKYGRKQIDTGINKSVAVSDTVR